MKLKMPLTLSEEEIAINEFIVACFSKFGGSIVYAVKDKAEGERVKARILSQTGLLHVEVIDAEVEVQDPTAKKIRSIFVMAMRKDLLDSRPIEPLPALSPDRWNPCGSKETNPGVSGWFVVRKKPSPLDEPSFESSFGVLYYTVTDQGSGWIAQVGSLKIHLCLGRNYEWSGSVTR